MPTSKSPSWLRLVVALGSLTALASLSIDTYLPGLPRLARDLNASTSEAQLSLTFCLLGLALGQLVAGPISDTWGRRRPLLWGLALYIAASVCCAEATTIGVLIVLRLCQGLSGASAIVIARAIARDHFHGNTLTNFLARLMLVNGASPILAPILGGQLLRFTSWRGVFWVLAALGLAMWVAVAWGLPESLESARRSPGGAGETLATFRRLLGDRRFMGYTLAQGLVLAAMFGYIAGSPFVLEALYGVSPQTFSLIFATNGLGIILAGQATPLLTKRYPEARVLGQGLAIAAFGALALLAVTAWHVPYPALLPALFFIVASVGVVSPAATALALEPYRQNAGSAAAFIGVAGMLAGTVTTPLVGIGGSHTAWPMALVIAASEALALLFYGLAMRQAPANRLTAR